MASLSGLVREFDPSQESFGTYARWLEQYLVATGVSGQAKRRATLLSVVGPKTFALLEDLVAPQTVSDLEYEQLVTVLQGHFEPKSSEIVARFRFHSCCRDENESVTEYAARLRRLAKPCQFPSETRVTKAWDLSQDLGILNPTLGPWDSTANLGICPELTTPANFSTFF